MDDSFENHPDPETELLLSARHGDAQAVRGLIKRWKDGEISLNLNCKGRNKANLGWAPLHLASYFGHTDAVQVLLENGADVNIVNNNGDTPLHKAALTGRLEVVLLLLQSKANVDVINAEGHCPKHLTRNSHIKELIKAVQNCEQRKVEEAFLSATTEGKIDVIRGMLNGESSFNINCVDGHGNTALHCAAYRGHKEVAVLLLQNGIDTNIKNNKGSTALAMCRDAQMKQLLDVRPIKELQKQAPRFEGLLLRRSKILGWKPVWVVLERGVLSVFNNRADSTTGTRRKASKYLMNANVMSKKDMQSVFIVHFADSSAMTFTVEQSNSTDLQLQKWVNALGDHIVYSTQMSGSINISDDEAEELPPLGSMQECLQNSQAHQQILERHVAMATKSIQEVTTVKENLGSHVTLVQLQQQLLQISELSTQMCQSLSHCLAMFTQQEEVHRLQLQQEAEKSRVLQDALHVLAQEQYQLEKSLQGHRSPTPAMYDSDQDEFYDCADDEGSSLSSSTTIGMDDKIAQLHVSPVKTNGTVLPAEGNSHSKWGGRCRLPKPMFSRHDFSVWSILKQCIGKELSKITMPVIFNEPISFVQRIVEYMEYANLLKLADQTDDPILRMEYVTAFAVSATASNWDRIGKPFNPLLGETYQLEREDLGFRIVCEQVSHHPPISAFHVESSMYTFHGTVHPKLKFWGKSVEVTPKGLVTLHLKRHNEVYSWQNVNCCVHNIIVGKIWVEHYGGMEITNHTTKMKASLNFKPCGWFAKELHKVDGCIYDKSRKKVRSFYGKWIEGLYTYDPDYNLSDGSIPQNKSAPAGLDSAADEYQPPEECPKVTTDSSCDLNIPGQRLLWSATPKPADSEQYYAFTLFAMMLNELPEEMRPHLAPTDSRLRPDIRKMEEGDIDGAAFEKNRLEEKQRAVRKERKKTKAEWKPLWFTQKVNPHTGKEDWIFKGDFWERNWENCPSIF